MRAPTLHAAERSGELKHQIEKMATIRTSTAASRITALRGTHAPAPRVGRAAVVAPRPRLVAARCVDCRKLRQPQGDIQEHHACPEQQAQAQVGEGGPNAHPPTTAKRLARQARAHDLLCARLCTQAQATPPSSQPTPHAEPSKETRVQSSSDPHSGEVTGNQAGGETRTQVRCRCACC